MALAEWCRIGKGRKGGIGDEMRDSMFGENGLSGPTDFGPLGFVMPPGELNPKQFVAENFSQGNGKPRMSFLKGTTTLAFCYKGKTPADKGGVIVAVDARASTGTYIASKTVTKILDISDTAVGTMAGGAADCQYWVRVLSKQCALYELVNKEKMSMAAASMYMSNVLYNYKGMGLSIGSMVAGVDKKGPSIYYVDQEGTRLKSNLFSIGSGMIAAYGVLDTEYKEEMTDEEAKELGKRAIMHATHQDVGSGGICNLCHITADSKEYTWAMDVSDMYDKFNESKGREPYDPPL